MTDKPLWLPEGSIRAILVIGVGASWIAGIFLELPAEQLAPLGGAAIAAGGYYFKSRERGNGSN